MTFFFFGFGWKGEGFLTVLLLTWNVSYFSIRILLMGTSVYFYKIWRHLWVGVCVFEDYDIDDFLINKLIDRSINKIIVKFIVIVVQLLFSQVTLNPWGIVRKKRSYWVSIYIYIYIKISRLKMRASHSDRFTIIFLRWMPHVNRIQV